MLPLSALPRLRYLTGTGANAGIPSGATSSAAWMAWTTLLAAAAKVKKGQRHALFGRDSQFWDSSSLRRSAGITGRRQRESPARGSGNHRPQHQELHGRKTDSVTASMTGIGSGSVPMRAASAAVPACQELGPIETAAPIAA